MQKKIEDLNKGDKFITWGGDKRKVTDFAIDVIAMCECCGRPLIGCDGRNMCPSIEVTVAL